MTNKYEPVIGPTYEDVGNLREAIEIVEHAIAQEVCNAMECVTSPLRERLQLLDEKRIELILHGLSNIGGKDD